MILTFINLQLFTPMATQRIELHDQGQSCERLQDAKVYRMSFALFCIFRVKFGDTITLVIMEFKVLLTIAALILAYLRGLHSFGTFEGGV